MIVKNTFGLSVITDPKRINPEFLGTFRGSSLDRKKEEEVKPYSLEENYKKEAEAEKTFPDKLREKKLRSLSSRTKSKIRKKILSFFGVYKRLTFLTLTFVNMVDDEKGVKLLGKFLDNIKKQDKDFEFVWVAERQTKNPVFEGNIHFHLISNKYWKIEKYWPYWIALQAKSGVIPRDESFKPSSAFDVKTITQKNAKGIGTYITKYVTKNEGEFKCQVWNCSKKISMLYTDFYTDYSFLRQLERLEKANEIVIKRVREEFCNLMYYPITKTTNRFYDRLHLKNKETWNLSMNNPSKDTEEQNLQSLLSKLRRKDSSVQ